MFCKTKTPIWSSRHRGGIPTDLWLIQNNSNSKSHLYLTLEHLFLYFLLNQIRTHRTVNFCNSFTKIITTECRRLIATPSLGIIPICSVNHQTSSKALQSPARPVVIWLLWLISCHFSLLAEHGADIQAHTCEISFCPPTLPLPSCLLANFYSSSSKAQLQCYPLSNADTSDPGKQYNSFLHVPHCTHSLIPEILPVGARRALQALSSSLGTVESHFQHSSASSFKPIPSSSVSFPNLGRVQPWLSPAFLTFAPYHPHHCWVSGRESPNYNTPQSFACDLTSSLPQLPYPTLVSPQAAWACFSHAVLQSTKELCANWNLSL